MRLILAALLIIGLTAPEETMGGKKADVLEKSGRGVINWSQGTIQATCEPSCNAESKKKKLKERGSSRNLRPISAEGDTFREDLLNDVLTTAHALRIYNKICVRDFIAEAKAYSLKVQDLVADAQIVLRTDTKDRITRATARIPIYGGFSQLVLPGEIKQIQTIQLMNTAHIDPNAPKGPAETEEFSISRPYTGLIVDARNIGALPALVPTIYDENGNEAYGPAFVSREFAVKYGLAGYTRCYKAALDHVRVTDNPLVVKGLRLHPSGPCNIVISNLDAARIRNTYDHLSFLKKCHVIVVID